MQIVKVSEQFYKDCVKHKTEQELLCNKSGRPCVLLLNLKYKGERHKFVVPIRSNISSNVPREQYFSLPPNSTTKTGNIHGIHYIKLFPISNKYIQKYRIDNNDFMLKIKVILDKNEKQIIRKCQQYLEQCEQGKSHSMTPNIEGIINWLYN